MADYYILHEQATTYSGLCRPWKRSEMGSPGILSLRAVLLVEVERKLGLVCVMAIMMIGEEEYVMVPDLLYFGKTNGAMFVGVEISLFFFSSL